MDQLETEVLVLAEPIKAVQIEQMAELGCRAWWRRSTTDRGQRVDRVTLMLADGSCITLG